MGFDRRALHSYTSIDFCLDEIGKIDWVYHFVNLKELTIVNQSVLEIEVSLLKSHNFLLGSIKLPILRKNLARKQQY